MARDLSFHDFVNRLKQGDEHASKELFDRYVHRLIGLARTQLDTRMHGKVDPEDVVQSVLKSFYVRNSAGKFEVTSWEGLWAILAVITARKCGRQAEFYHAAKRDVRRESRLVAEHDDANPEPSPIDDLSSVGDAAILIETVEQMMDGLTEREQQIISLRLQGLLIPEISDEIGRSESTVRRTLKLARNRLETILDDNG